MSKGFYQHYLRGNSYSHVFVSKYSGWGITFAWLFSLFVTTPSLWSQQSAELAKISRTIYQGHYEEAALLATNYKKSHPQSIPGWILLARAEMARGKFARAYQELQGALVLEPKNIDTLYYLGQLCDVLSQIQFQDLYALAPNSARVHQLRAELYRLQENTAKVEEEYEEALRANPQSAEVLVALGDLARTKFRFDEALVYYFRAAEIEPRNYDCAYGIGACYHFQQKPQKAIEYFRKALTIAPNSAAARLALGDDLLRTNQFAAAAVEIKLALVLEPKMRQAYTLLGRAHQKLGQSQEAEFSFKKAQELIQEEIKSRQSILDMTDPTSLQPAPVLNEDQNPELKP